MNHAIFSVSGIANQQMKTSLKNALDKIEGVRTVEIDKALGRVEVSFNEPADENQIKNSVKETGFSLT